MISRLIDLYREATNETLKQKLKEAAQFAFDLEFADKYSLTSEEVMIGKHTGKIACIKMLRERTGMGLKDAKDLAENYFNKNNLEFYNPYNY